MVAVLMSTYNGQSYLKEQLDSILSQNYSDFVLLIRDDGSSDETVQLIRSYADPRIRVIEGTNLGPAASFFSLLQMVPEADYIFFSDQDDIWFPEKMNRLLSEIKCYDHEPTMVFSDFTMIDSDGKVTANSYADYASLQVKPGKNPLAKVIAQPYAFGCASVINRALADIVKDPPVGIEMHDCWISQCAAAMGNLIFVPEQTIAHRFHSRNATGKTGQDSFITRLKRVTADFSIQSDNSALRLRQVELLLKHRGEYLLPEARFELLELRNAFRKGKISSVLALHKHGVNRQKRLNTFYFYLTVLGIKGDIL